MTSPDEFPRLRAVTAALTVQPHTDSTNADLAATVVARPDTAELTAVVTLDQRAGRGRLDRVWQAPAGTSAALSVLVSTGQIPTERLGWIPLAAGLAMTGAVGSALTGSRAEAALKWPNDVLVDGRKISGILCEVAAPGQIIVGAGVNTTMSVAQLPVPTATSFAVVGAAVDPDVLLADFVTRLTEHCRNLNAARGDADRSGLRAAVRNACGTIGSAVTVDVPQAAEVTGTARDIDELGRLVVGTASGPVALSAGDVRHVR